VIESQPYFLYILQNQNLRMKKLINQHRDNVVYLHVNTRRWVPDTFSSGEVGIHWLTCTWLNDLHPLPSAQQHSPLAYFIHSVQWFLLICSIQKGSSAICTTQQLSLITYYCIGVTE